MLGTYFPYRDELRYHRAQLQAAGHDPDFIGVTEVEPVRCVGCREPLPWAVVRGWDSGTPRCTRCGTFVPHSILRRWQD